MKLKFSNLGYLARIFSIWAMTSGLLSSCILSTEKYDSSKDDGTYSGTMTVYTGPGTDPNFIDRTCPKVTASLSILNGVAELTTDDNYPNYTHSAAVVVHHVATGTIYANNKFQLSTGWAIEETDTQLEDLMNLKICDSTPPSLPGDTSTGNRGLLQEFYLSVSDKYFVGEFGGNQARGSLIYGVRCTDGQEIPLCIYFMDLTKN